jgi:hypothetical protein
VTGRLRTLRPRSVDHLIALSGIEVDLFNTSRARTLNRGDLFHAWETAFILEVSKCERLRLLYKAIKAKAECIFVDNGDAAVIANEVEWIWSDVFLCN